MSIDELRRLEQAATPGPWKIVSRGGSYFGWDVDPAPSGMRGQFELEADAALIAALRNAAPGLLRVVEAARAYHEAEFFYDALRDALNTPGERERVDQDRAAATVERMRLARLEVAAALAALEEAQP